MSAMLLLSGNWYFGAHGWGETLSYPLWTICVEEQFYLIWPALMKFAGKRLLRIACFILIVVGMMVLAWFGAQNVVPVPHIYTNSFVLFQFFAIGAIIAYYTETGRPNFRLPARFGIAAFGMALFFVSVVVFDVHEHFVPVGLLKLVAGYACIDVGCVAVFFAFLGSRIPKQLSILVYFGRISYGLYVFHVMSLELARWTLSVVIHQTHSSFKPVLGLIFTVVFAALSYRYIETPFLKLKEKIYACEVQGSVGVENTECLHSTMTSHEVRVGLTCP